MKVTKNLAMVAIEIAKIYYREPSVKDPLLIWAKRCINYAEECIRMGEYEAAVVWAKESIAHTRGPSDPVLWTFGGIY